MGKKTFVQICPKCGSTNVQSIYLISPVELSRPGAKQLLKQIEIHPIGAPIMGWQPTNPSIFICKDCDYNGICPEVDSSQVQKFKKQIKKR